MGHAGPLIVIMDRAFFNHGVTSGHCSRQNWVFVLWVWNSTGWWKFSQQEDREDWDSVLVCYKIVVGFKAFVNQGCLFGISDKLKLFGLLLKHCLFQPSPDQYWLMRWSARLCFGGKGGTQELLQPSKVCSNLPQWLQNTAGWWKSCGSGCGLVTEIIAAEHSQAIICYVSGNIFFFCYNWRFCSFFAFSLACLICSSLSFLGNSFTTNFKNGKYF